MSDKPATDKPARPAWGWITLALALGMLIWVRLRLVTDIPRSVYAEPESSVVEPDHTSPQAPAAHSPAAQPDARVATHPDATR